MGSHWAEGSKKYRVIGMALSVCWATVISGYLLFNKINLLHLEPNEFGDFLAGALGPLGILWIVLGFWQQGDELRSSVDALNLQSEELKKSVEQQKALVEITRSQAEAEIQALHEEREVRRLANYPQLKFVDGGGSSSGHTVISNVKLVNLGADCTDVIVLSFENDVKQMSSCPILKSRADLTVQFRHTTDTPIDFEVEVRFYSIVGDHSSKRFRFTKPDPTVVNYDVTPI